MSVIMRLDTTFTPPGVASSADTLGHAFNAVWCFTGVNCFSDKPSKDGFMLSFCQYNHDGTFLLVNKSFANTKHTYFLRQICIPTIISQIQTTRNINCAMIIGLGFTISP